MINDNVKSELIQESILPTYYDIHSSYTYVGRCISIIEDFILRNCLKLIKILFKAIKYAVLIIKTHLNRNLKSPYTSAFYLSIIAILSYSLRRIILIINNRKLDRFYAKYSVDSLNQMFDPPKLLKAFTLKVKSSNYWKLETQRVMHLQKLGYKAANKQKECKSSKLQGTHLVQSTSNDSAFFKILVCYLQKL